MCADHCFGDEKWRVFTYVKLSRRTTLGIISVVNAWWGGRNMADMLPKLFFVHFRQTGFIAECDGKVVGFLVGFLSQTLGNEAYIHFVGVHPEFRKRGIGEALYERFFGVAKTFGRSVVR